MTTQLISSSSVQLQEKPMSLKHGLLVMLIPISIFMMAARLKHPMMTKHQAIMDQK